MKIHVIDKIKMMIDQNLLKHSFLSVFTLGFIAHGYCLSNILISHDSLSEFYSSNTWPKAYLGRIFYGPYIALTRGRIALPWLNGILALCWITLAVYLVLRIYNIKKLSYIILISGIFVTNPTVYALMATYIHDLDVDMFSMMLSVIAIYLWSRAIKKNNKKKFLLLLVGGGVLSVALGIYQSYISLAITLIIIWSIKELLENKSFKEVMVNGCYGIGMLIIAAISYIIELKVFEILTGVSAMSSEAYNGLGNLSQIFSRNIVGNILGTYQNFVYAFKNIILSFYSESISLIILGILVILMVLIALRGLIKIKWANRIVFIVLSVLLPLGMNIACFLNNGTGHVLMQYAIWMIYLLALILNIWIQEEKTIPLILKKGIWSIAVGCICLTIIENIQVANAIYVKKDLEYQSTLSYMTRVAERIEEQEEYIPGETSVLFIGQDIIGNTRMGFERYMNVTGAGGKSPITYYATYKNYFRYILGTTIILDEDRILENDERVLEMSVFPKEGSIKMLDGVLVVKLADK